MTHAPAGLTESHAARAARRGNWWCLMGAAALLLSLDQIVKWVVATNLPPGEVVAVTAWFNLVHVRNPGASFSFLADAGGWQRHALIAVGVAVSATLAALLWRGVRTRLEMIAYVGMIGGALGNVVDRMRIGAVIDYLDLHWRDMHWPAFNLADIFVVGSAALLIWASFRPGLAGGRAGQGNST